MCLDYFRIKDLKEANIEELRRVLVFTCRGETDPIEVRHLESGKVNEKEAIRNTVPFKEVGPCFNMRLRREKMATFELYKEACKKPKVRNVEKKKANKNTYTTAFGEKKGKIYIQHANIDTLATRKYKGMGKKKGKGEGEGDGAQ